MSKAEATATSGGGCGCITIILTLIVIWATIFGVTIGGVHHELSCSCKKGVEVTDEPTVHKREVVIHLSPSGAASVDLSPTATPSATPWTGKALDQ